MYTDSGSRERLFHNRDLDPPSPPHTHSGEGDKLPLDAPTKNYDQTKTWVHKRTKIRASCTVEIS